MIQWNGGVTLDETRILSEEASGLINAVFPPPNKIVFEKTFTTYLLLGKKKYSGYKCELLPDGSWNKFLDSSGLEDVRRDNCAFLRNTFHESLRIMCVEGDPNAALEYAKDACVRLLEGKVEFGDLIITMEYGKHWTAYKSLNAAASLAKRAELRAGAEPYAEGDRIDYVMVVKSKSVKLSDCSEDPLFALENKLPIDYKWYLTNQMAKPLYRIFQFIPGVTQKLFTHGPHLNRVVKPKPMVTRKGGIMSMFKPKPKCVVCSVTIASGRLCDSKLCIDAEMTQVNDKKRHAIQVRSKAEEIWANCNNCAGDIDSANACTNRECDKFYARYILRNAKDEITEEMKRVNILDW